MNATDLMYKSLGPIVLTEKSSKAWYELCSHICAQIGQDHTVFAASTDNVKPYVMVSLQDVIKHHPELDEVSIKDNLIVNTVIDILSFMEEQVRNNPSIPKDMN